MSFYHINCWFDSPAFQGNLLNGLIFELSTGLLPLKSQIERHTSIIDSFSRLKSDSVEEISRPDGFNFFLTHIQVVFVNCL